MYVNSSESVAGPDVSTIALMDEAGPLLLRKGFTPGCALWAAGSSSAASAASTSRFRASRVRIASSSDARRSPTATIVASNCASAQSRSSLILASSPVSRVSGEAVLPRVCRLSALSTAVSAISLRLCARFRRSAASATAASAVASAAWARSSACRSGGAAPAGTPMRRDSLTSSTATEGAPCPPLELDSALPSTRALSCTSSADTFHSVTRVRPAGTRTDVTARVTSARSVYTTTRDVGASATETKTACSSRSAAPRPEPAVPTMSGGRCSGTAPPPAPAHPAPSAAHVPASASAANAAAASAAPAPPPPPPPPPHLRPPAMARGEGAEQRRACAEWRRRRPRQLSPKMVFDGTRRKKTKAVTEDGV